MTLSRRRFLTITAAMLATPASAARLRWQGRALGADCTLEIHAPRDQAERALRDVRALLRLAEARFSLYDPSSELSKLNAAGTLAAPSLEMTEILALCDRAHHATGGTFDPTVQTLWEALSTGTPVDSAASLVGWTRVQRTPPRLDKGQKLTLNGVAQGFATDMVAGALRAAGLSKVLVNIGEFSALGGPFHVGMSDPTHGLFGTATLENSAIAISSPAATMLGTAPHILSATGRIPQWNTVSVQAQNAALADAASTAFCLMGHAEIERAIPALDLTRATMLDSTGRVHHIG